MEQKKRGKQNFLTGLIVFMLFMWLCTIISKSIYAAKLPVVTVESPEGKYIEHLVKAKGVVEATAKQPVTALPGLRVESLAIRVGDQIEEGDLLFTIDMGDLEQIMGRFRMERAELQVQLNTLLTNKELAAQRKEKEEERAREDYETLARYQDTLVGRAAEEVAQAERKIGDSGGESGTDPEEWERLQDELKAAAYAEADAKGNRDELMKEAGRRIEDITAAEDADAAISLYQMDIAKLDEQLSAYQGIADEQGQIMAKAAGIVTDLYIGVGGRIPDTAVMLLADDTVPYEFRAVLSADQKQYLKVGNEVTIELDGRYDKMKAEVTYLTEDDNLPGTYYAGMKLPEGTGIPGMSGTLTRVETGQWQECCIPARALYTVENRTYVYIVQEKEGILGKEYCARIMDVRVLDQNEDFASLEMTLPSDSLIIVSSTEEFAHGDIIRISQ